MENGMEEEPLFDPEILKRISWEDRHASFRDGVSPSNPGDNLILRPLHLSDFDAGYLQLLSQLTVIGEVSRDDFKERFHSLKSCASTYFVSVLEDTSTNQVIGSASLILEHKFIHSTGKRGRVEDVIVSSDYRGKQLGKLLVEAMTLLGKALGCYKMSLECKDENMKFYQSFGYEPDGQYFMVQRYKE